MKAILAVDDAWGIRLMCERQLRCEDYVMWPVSCDPETLEFIYTDPRFDLIVLKVKVAPIEDTQVLKRLWAKQIDIVDTLNWDNRG